MLVDEDGVMIWLLFLNVKKRMGLYYRKTKNIRGKDACNDDIVQEQGGRLSSRNDVIECRDDVIVVRDIGPTRKYKMTSWS